MGCCTSSPPSEGVVGGGENSPLVDGQPAGEGKQTKLAISVEEVHPTITIDPPQVHQPRPSSVPSDGNSAQSAPRGSEQPPDPSTAKKEDLIKKFYQYVCLPFFHALKENKPWSKLDLLASLFEFEKFPYGSTICKEGEVGDKFYVVCWGTLEARVNRDKLMEVKKKDQLASLFDKAEQGKELQGGKPRANTKHDREEEEGKEAPPGGPPGSEGANTTQYLLDRITPDKPANWFGELSMMHGTPRMATITCISPYALCLSCTRGNWEKFIQTAPELRQSMEPLMKQRVAGMLKTMQLFKHVIENKPFSKVDLIGNLFEYESVTENTAVWKPGDNSNKFYVIIKGKLELVDKYGAMSTLQDQDHVGDIDLMRKTTRQSTLISLTPVTFLWVDGDKFETMISIAPELRAYFDLVLETRRKMSIAVNAKYKSAPLVAATKMPSVAEESTEDEKPVDLDEIIQVIIKSNKEHITDTKDNNHGKITNKAPLDVPSSSSSSSSSSLPTATDENKAKPKQEETAKMDHKEETKTANNDSNNNSASAPSSSVAALPVSASAPSTSAPSVSNVPTTGATSPQIHDEKDTNGSKAKVEDPSSQSHPRLQESPSPDSNHENSNEASRSVDSNPLKSNENTVTATSSGAFGDEVDKLVGRENQDDISIQYPTPSINSGAVQRTIPSPLNSEHQTQNKSNVNPIDQDGEDQSDDRERDQTISIHSHLAVVDEDRERDTTKSIVEQAREQMKQEELLLNDSRSGSAD